MPVSISIVGTRIRQRRREKGIRQADLAARVGISPSYLNLIEWNKRRIAGGLLNRIADALELSLDEISGASDRRVLETLGEIAQFAESSELGVETDRTSELIGRFPGWSRAITALARSERSAVMRARVLSDRLSNDPFLGETVHRMLTRISAIRSTSEILSEFSDIPDDQRARFTDIIKDEVQALSDVGEALASYLDQTVESDRVLTPLDEVESFFEIRENRIEEIERASVGLMNPGAGAEMVSRRDRAAALAENRLGNLVDNLIETEIALKTEAARRRARRSLMNYATNAILMPMEAFARRAAGLRYDIDALADAFSTDIDIVCHRLTALPAGDAVPKFGYMRANAAGTIIEMLGLPGLTVPRYAAACPLWALYRAQQSPETVIRQRTLFPSGERFVFVARARHIGPSGFGKPRHYVTDMLATSELDARHTVYAPDRSSLVEEVGPSCRLCPREKCAHRVDDPLAP